MATSDRALKSLTFPIQYLEIGASLTRELSLNVDALYDQCGVESQASFLPWQRINGKQLQLVLAHFLKLCPADTPPLVTFMSQFPLNPHGAVGLLVMKSATLAEALQGLLAYSSMVMPAHTLKRHDIGEEVHFVFEPKHDLGEVNHFFTETVVAMPLKILDFLKQPLSCCAVHLAHAPIGDPAAYAAALPASFTFNAKQNKLVIAREDLNVDLVESGRAADLMRRASLMPEREANVGHRPISQEVKRRLQRAMFQKQALEAMDVASSLTISPRTLSRRLRAEGVTLPQLRREVYLAYAEILMLESENTIAQIANAAGFSDAATFTRAFKRTKGETPSQWRDGKERRRSLVASRRHQS